MSSKRKYTDFDFENLVELYTKNSWLRLQANHEGFEDLWFDYTEDDQKIIIKKLIEKFKYLAQEEAEAALQVYLKILINDWDLNTSNTIFIGFKKTKYADGSSILLNFLKPVLHSIDPSWQEQNLFSYLYHGIDRIKKGGIEDYGIDLKNVVLIDDFIGTGGTAIKISNLVKEAINKQKKPMNLYVFSLAAMEEGKAMIEAGKINFSTCFILKKGTELAFPEAVRIDAQNKIRDLEKILHEGREEMKLEDYSLGYGNSEALYAWNRFNIPNNNFPIFWWHRYLDGSKRKTMFNRGQ